MFLNVIQTKQKNLAEPDFRFVINDPKNPRTVNLTQIR